MNITELNKHTKSIADHRRIQRQLAAERLRSFRHILEADWLIQAHVRIRTPDFEEIVAEAPDPNVPDERFFPPAPYSRLLGGQLELLVLVGWDRLFVGPSSSTEINKAEILMDKLAALSVEESVALHALLDAAEKILVVVFHHSLWWHADELMFLLERAHAEKCPY